MGPFPEPRDNVMKSTTADADAIQIADQNGSQSARLSQFTGMEGTESDRGNDGRV